ncbi:MAG: DUF4190 domain-containing protein [Planctomycetes bacterium]|nr:DUF4190 domain-containing protein [Planctomycetota bacterium]
MNNEPPPINPAGFSCIECGYDVSGTPVGGTCPECGKSVEDSLRAVQYADKSCSYATASMIFGILSLVACVVLGPVAIFSYYTAKKEMAVGGYSKSSHTMAKAGLIMGIISSAFIAILVIFTILSNFM